jgi:hypothetical protein
VTRPVCTAARCEAGWVHVTTTYADRIAPEPVLPDDAGPEWDVVRAGLIAEWRARHGAALNTVYPCRECQPDAFHRWLGGHMASDHDTADCEECQPPPGAHRRRRRKLVPQEAIPGGTGRRDLE